MSIATAWLDDAEDCLLVLTYPTPAPEPRSTNLRESTQGEA
jgi:hypothetical protein